MDARVQHASGPRKDPHDWNSLENFIYVHETRLAQHPFVDHSRSSTLRFEEFVFDGATRISLAGDVFCHHNVVLEVDKQYATRIVGGRRQIRGLRYRYNARVRGRHNVLRYDNGHAAAPEEFHRHFYRIADGEELERRILARHELPTFADILTELQIIFEGEAAL